MLCFWILNSPFFRRSRSQFNAMLTPLLFSMRSSRQRSKKSRRKAWPWHVQEFPRSSRDCFTAHLAPLLAQSCSTAAVSCKTWLAGATKGNPHWLVVLSASLPFLLPSPQPSSSLPLSAEPNSAPLTSGSVNHHPLPTFLLGHCTHNISSSLAVKR